MSGHALPTGRSGRILALGIALIVMLAAWFAIASPLLDWHAERADRLDQRRTLERRMAGVAATLPQLRQSETARTAKGPVPTTLLDGATDAVAAASLQERVQEMATQVGAALTSAETLPATQAGTYRRIGLHVSLIAPWTVLVQLLQLVEQASPRMLVDDLQLHGARMVAAPADPPLEADFTVFAFRAGAATPQAAAP